MSIPRRLALAFPRRFVSSAGFRKLLRVDASQLAGVQPQQQNGLTLSMQAKGRARRGAPSRRSAPPLVPPGPLSVGDSWNDGDFTCVVRKACLTCRNRARHGWFLGRSSFKIF